MLTKIKNLSARAKAGLGAGLALLAAAGVGLGVWQPWKQAPEEPVEPVNPPQQVQGPRQPEVQGPQIQVGSETINCTVYTGQGWSICVPENWTAEEQGENGVLLSSGDGAEMTLELLPGGGNTGSFAAISGGEEGAEMTLRFYAGTGEPAPVLAASAPADRWNQYDKLFAALARTLTVGQDKPFAEIFVVPQEPDWQEADGMTVLFLDKDGFVLDEEVQKAVEAYMLSWPEEEREGYTGRYRVDGIAWDVSYTGLTENYIDVFRAGVAFEESGGGWTAMSGGVLLAVHTDGSSVERTQWLNGGAAESLEELAGLLAQ